MKKFFRNHWEDLGIAAAIGILVAVALCQPNGFGLDAAAETTSHPDGRNGKIEAMTPAEKMQAIENLVVPPEMVRPECDSAAHENHTSRVNATACAGNEDQDANANIIPSADRQPVERHLTAEATREVIDKIQNFMIPMFLLILAFVISVTSWFNRKKAHREEKEGETLEEKLNELKLSVPEDIWLTSARGKAELQKRYPSAPSIEGAEFYLKEEFFKWVAWYSLELFNDEKISLPVLEQISKKLRNGEITTLSEYHLCLTRAKNAERNENNLCRAADIIDTYIGQIEKNEERV